MLTGHKVRGAISSYIIIPDDDLLADYCRAEPLLSISETVPTEKKIGAMVGERTSELGQLVEELRGEVREVRGELDSVRTITGAVVGMVMMEPLEETAKKRVDNFVGVVSRMVREREAELGRKIEAAELTRIMAEAFKKSPPWNLIRDWAEGKLGRSGRRK